MVMLIKLVVVVVVVFRLQVYKRVRTLLVEIYEAGVGAGGGGLRKSVISVCKKAPRALQMHFMSVKKSRKRSGFRQCIHSS